MLFKGRVFNKLIIAILLLVAVFWKDFYALLQLWLVMDGAYSHGLLLAMCSGWLLWKQNYRINRTFVKVNIFGVVLFVGILLIWLSARLLLIDVVSQSLLPALMLTMILSVFGGSVLKYCLLPMTLLWFAIPFWDYLGFSLQQLTVAAIQLPLKLLQVGFIIQGIFVELPGIGVFEVAFGCSGLRYLLIACVLSLLISELWFVRLSHRIAVVIIGIFLGLLSNWLRVAAIIYIGHETNMESSLVDDHETFGWVLFALVVSPAIWWAARWSEKNVTLKVQVESELVESSYKAGAICFLFLFALSVAAHLYSSQEIVVVQGGSKTQQAIAGWKPLPVALDDSLGAKVKNPDQLIQGSYFRGSQQDLERLTLTIYGYQFQRSGAELFGFGNRFFDGNRWTIKQQAQQEEWSLSELVPASQAPSVERHFLANSYFVGGNFYADALTARVKQLPAQFNGDRYAAAITLHLQCSNCELSDLDYSNIKSAAQSTIHNINTN